MSGSPSGMPGYERGDRRASAQEPFNRRTLFWGIFASLLAAAGFFLLSTYAPDFRLGSIGGATPLSKSGIGYAGLAELMALTGDPPEMARSETIWTQRRPADRHHFAGQRSRTRSIASSSCARTGRPSSCCRNGRPCRFPATRAGR